MIVIGYRGNVEWSKVKAALKKCTNLSQSDIDKIVKNVKAGQTEQIPNDFVLYDELRELNLLVKS